MTGRPLPGRSAPTRRRCFTRWLGKRVLCSAQAPCSTDFGTYPFVRSSNLCRRRLHGRRRGSRLDLRRHGRDESLHYARRLRSLPDRSGRARGHPLGGRKEYGTTTEGSGASAGWTSSVAFGVARHGMTSLAMTKLDTLANIHPIKAAWRTNIRASGSTRFPSRAAPSFS